MHNSNRKIAATVMVFLALLTGCASGDAKVKTWIGSTESSVISSYGVPTRSIKTNDGKDIFTYDNMNGYGHVVCQYTFTASAKGVIESAQSNCPW